LKRLVLFAIFSCALVVLVPMVSSVETRLVEDEIKEKYYDINFLINNLKNFVRFDISIFIKSIILWFLSPIPILLIYLVRTEEYYNFFNVINTYIILLLSPFFLINAIVYQSEFLNLTFIFRIISQIIFVYLGLKIWV